jgi:Reticulon
MSSAVADIALWRNKRLSALILFGVTIAWILFEVAEYHFLTLLCHVAIAAMLFIFLWSNGATLLDLYLISVIILSKECYRIIEDRKIKFTICNLQATPKDS